MIKGTQRKCCPKMTKVVKGITQNWSSYSPSQIVCIKNDRGILRTQKTLLFEDAMLNYHLNLEIL